MTDKQILDAGPQASRVSWRLLQRDLAVPGFRECKSHRQTIEKRRRHFLSAIHIGMRVIPAVAFLVFFSLPAVAESSPDAPAPAIVSGQPEQPVQGREWNVKERWEYYLEESFLSPGAFFRAAGPALGQQLGDTPPEWEQGMSGYHKRLADQFAVRTVQGTIEFGTAAAMDIDPRYRPCDCSGFFPRLGYALLSNAVTYKTDGSRAFNAPNFLGSYGSSFTALTWYPSRYSYKDAFREGTQSLAFGGSFNIIREFWPEIRRVWPFARKK